MSRLMNANSSFCKWLGVGCLACLLTAAAAHGSFMYASDFNDGTILNLSSSGAVSVFASGFAGPEGLAFDTSRNLYAADVGSGSIKKITPNGAISTFASGLAAPQGLAFDIAGNLYAANQNLNTIVKINPSGAVSTFATGMNYPQGVAFDSKGNLYVANYGNNTVSKITPTGTVSLFANTPRPLGLTVDFNDNLYIANGAGNSTIRKITPTGTNTIYASGFEPYGLCFDSTSGNLFATTGIHGSINAISPSGAVSQFASGMSYPLYPVTQMPEIITINSARVHVGDEPELAFTDWGPFVGTSWEVSFNLPTTPSDTILRIESFDVEAPPDFQDKLFINGTYVGNLAYVGGPDWYSASAAMPVLASLLHAGQNTLRIESGYGQGIYDHPTYDDFGVGQITLSYVPEPAALMAVPLLGVTVIMRRRRVQP